MLITFFVGNGFDLNNGMHTKFRDFYDHIQKIKSPKEIANNQIYSNIEKNKDQWSYFEMQLGQLTFDYNQESKDKLLEDIEGFRDDFIDYMIEQNKRFSFERNKAKSVFIKSLVRYMDQLNETEKVDLLSIYNLYPSNRTFNFVNFNYTDTLEQIVNIFEPNKSFARSVVKRASYENLLGTIIPIHKQLNTGMFLGVNDDTQINSTIFDSIEKISLIKPLANDEFRDDTNKKVETLVDNSNIIIIYGMSLGETDKKWWEYLGIWLGKNPNNRLIIYIHDENFSKNSPLKYLKKREEYENRFIGFSYDLSDIELKDKISTFRKRIYLISNSDSDFKFLEPNDIKMLQNLAT